MDHETEEAFYILGTLILIISTPILIFFKVFRNAKAGKKMPKILDGGKLGEGL